MSADGSDSPLVLTMGDPCGIGPEIIARAHVGGGLSACLVVADPEVIRRGARAAGLSFPLAVIEQAAEWNDVPPRCMAVFRPAGLPEGLSQLPWGTLHAAAGRAAAVCIESAVALVQAHCASGIVTAPVHKGALHAAGVPYPGHTEMLQMLSANFTGHKPEVRMMLANKELRVLLVTIHVALRQALEMLTVHLILETIAQAQAIGQRLGLERPRIAVAGVNPHAGEGGLFGDEEARLIAPAIALAQARGWDASGPHAPDTVFMRARNTLQHPGEFDFVVAMTHDHGLIPVKYLGVEDGVNVTLGLPWVRTSPDHGTAFDIAGRGLADASSLQSAVHMARLMARA
jgi:4-hydroxythreonine-4-phosphate dehydrogenase